jgi:SNF2 family DNA or RNA helicase
MYQWPIKPGWEPLPHQRETTAFLVQNPKAFCFNEMGTMKTLSALWAADFTMEWEKSQGRECRTLIVAPLSILRVVWEFAVFTHFMGARHAVVLHGSAEKRRELLAQPADFYIINPSGLKIGLPADSKSPLKGLASDLAKRDDIKIAIVDEASAYRRLQDTHRAARILLSSRPYLWLLTGTPIPNGPMDAHGLARLVGITNESERSWRARVMYQPNGERFKWLPRAGSEQLVHKLLQPAIRFSADFLNLPPCTPEQREVPFSREQEAAYKALKKFAIHMVETGEMVKAVNQAALRMKLIQVAAGVVYGPPEQNGVKPSYELNPSPRLNEVRSIIAETERKIIIFAPLTNVLNMLKANLTDWESEIVNGETPLTRRGDIFRRFGDTKDPLRVLFLDPATVSHGINELVSASVAVWYAPTDKSEHYQQGNKRIHRPGQLGATKIVQLVSTSIEKDIYRRLEIQENMQDLVLKLAEGERG